MDNPQSCTIRTEEPVFAITIDGQELLGFRVESRWEGFAKYVRQSTPSTPNGVDWIIITEVPFAPLRELLRPFAGEALSTDQAVVVAISPHLFSTLNDVKAKSAEDGAATHVD
jgi:hypothetical protein